MAARRPARPTRLGTASVDNERRGLIDALDGKRIAAGPAGSPHRERRDVMPTGRNMFTSDPRTLPTPTAMDLGRLAADEVIRGYMQSHGEMPRALVIDLWGSATLRTGGEEIAQGLALMGCRPNWDHATGRVLGVEVLPCAAMGRPRVDVTWRISGLFRDLFPAQIALLDAAVRAVAARDETQRRKSARGRRAATATPHARAHLRHRARRLRRGLEALIGQDDATATTSARPISPRPRTSMAAPTARAITRPAPLPRGSPLPTCWCTSATIPRRDLLEGGEDAAFVGGFAAAAATLGRNPDLVMLDMTDPRRPRARPLSDALARIVRARAISPRFIAGQMRHGPRGAAEFAETVDRLVDFAETTGAVPSALLDLVHEAYLVDERGARLPDAGKSRRRARHRRAARCRRDGLACGIRGETTSTRALRRCRAEAAE